MTEVRRTGPHLVAINESGAMVFTIDPSSKYDESDSYFKKSRLKVTMSARLQKFPRVKDQLRPMSHEAIAFRGLGGRDIPLGVFGYLTHFENAACQIKPYAIWLPHNAR
jgi:hypothetical protein